MKNCPTQLFHCLEQVNQEIFLGQVALVVITQRFDSNRKILKWSFEGRAPKSWHVTPLRIQYKRQPEQYKLKFYFEEVDSLVEYLDSAEDIASTYFQKVLLFETLQKMYEKDYMTFSTKTEAEKMRKLVTFYERHPTFKTKEKVNQFFGQNTKNPPQLPFI